MAKPKTHKTSIDLDTETREQMIALLNQQLADTFDLYSQTKQAHWNVKGPDFIQLHEFFDGRAPGVLAYVDLLAERVTTLGGTALGTARMAAAATRLDEYSATVFNGTASVEALVARYAALAASSRAAIDTADGAKDLSTADIFTEISRGLDKSLWFLEAHLQAKE